MGGPHIRRALVGEATSLSSLAFAAKAHWGYTDEAMRSWQEALAVTEHDVASTPTFVAEIDATLAGFYRLAPAPRTWSLEHLWVAPRYMRRGIGRALLAHALDVAARGGAGAVSIDADPNAEPFYLACGATRRGELAAPLPGQPARVRPQLWLTVGASLAPCAGP